jgi:hypothetical protein
VSQNKAGDWYLLPGGQWILAELLERQEISAGNPSQTPQPTPAPDKALAAPAFARTPRATELGRKWTFVADSASDYPGGRDHNNWYYLWTPGRHNFEWQDLGRSGQDSCYQSPNDWGLQICRETIRTNEKGDVAVQWKASRGGTYRFEWDAPALSFYQHGIFVGSQNRGVELPHSAIIENVIDWEMFFWVAEQDTSYHITVHRLDTQ